MATAPARVCPCGRSRVRWGEDEATERLRLSGPRCALVVRCGAWDVTREDVPAGPCVLGLPELRLGPRDLGPPGFQRCADATEHGRLELPHQLADVLHLPCPRPVCAHPLRRDHGLVQDLRQIKPGQLGGG